MSSRIITSLVIVHLVSISVINATIINVPGDQSTIQAGINVSVDGDTVLVYPGTYVENINFSGKSIVVGSLFLTSGETSNIAQTIISGGSIVVVFNQGEDAESKLVGFSITGGQGLGIDEPYMGGGIMCNGSSPIISDCIIYENSGDIGAGFLASNSSAKIINCTFRDHNAGSMIDIYDSSNIALLNCQITHNTDGVFAVNGSYLLIENTNISDNFGSGHTFSNGTESTVEIINSLITGNTGEALMYNSGPSMVLMNYCTIVENDKIVCNFGSTLNINNSIAWYNTSPLIENWGAQVTINYSNLQTSWPGTANINSEPLFVSLSEEDFRLSSSSPCIGAGTDSIEIEGTWYHAPTTDLNGNPRPSPSDSNPDIGAYESSLAEPIQIIESIYPNQNAQNIGLNTDISVTFGTDIDPSTINSNTFVVHASQSGLHNGTYSYYPGTKTVTLLMDNEFIVGENVNVTLTSGIQDADNYPIIPFHWEYTIETFMGSGRFSEKVDYSSGFSPWFVTTSDLDMDGDIDLASVNFNSNSISIHLNRGDGSFTSNVDYGVGSSPSSIASTDFDRDGDMDIAVANRDHNTISILMNYGDGTFAFSADSSAGNEPYGIVLSDLNLDGNMDLAVANHGSNSVSIFMNNGDGSLAFPVDYSTGSGPVSIASADLDSDGDIDLAIANEGSNAITIFMNEGDGNFASGVDYSSGNSPWSVTSSDLDLDGDMDLAVANYGSNSVSIFMNNGDGSFLSRVDYGTDNDPLTVISSDLDGDRDMDLAIANQGSNTVTVLMNVENGVFVPNGSYAVGEQPHSVTACDLDGDGDIDLAVGYDQTSAVSILFNNDVYSTQVNMESAVEFSDSISIGYNISNPDSLISSLDCSYSVNNESTWNLATILGDTLNLTADIWDGTIIWDSFSDLPGQDISDVIFSIRPYNLTMIGIPGLSKPFHLDNNRIPSIELTPISGEQRLDITLLYQLLDIEDDTLGIICDYYDSSSETWQMATITGDTSALSNNNGQLTWNSRSDHPVAYGERLFRITPYDIDLGASDTVVIFIDQLGISVAEQISQYTSEQSDDVIVNYTLSDDENDTLNILLEYSIDSGNNWSPTTVTGTSTGIAPTQYGGNITWNSRDDLPGVDKTTVKLKLTPSDSNPGLPVISDDFHLDNNLPPTISYISIPDSIVVVASLEYTISDIENDTLDISIEYSTDLGYSWLSGFGGGELSTILPDNYAEIVDWYTYESFGFQRLQNVWVRFKVADNDIGADTTLRDITILNYPAEYTGDLQINTEDLVIFAAAWNAEPQNTIYEIGPATGTVPELTPEPDSALDFEDLGVFVQMWNWSYEHNGLTKPSQLARSISETPSILNFNIVKPEDKWLSDGLTLIIMESIRDDFLQVEWVLEYSGQAVSVSSTKGDYFDTRYQTSPYLTKVSNDSSMTLFCSVGLGKLDNSLPGNTITNISISNKSDAVQAVSLFYRVWDESANIVESGHIKLDIESMLPDEFSLQQNFPNPFNPNTTIRYTLPKQTKVSLDIYNIRGELVNTLISKSQEAGYYQLIWNGTNEHGKTVSAGMYLYRISTSAFTATKKMVLLK